MKLKKFKTKIKIQNNKRQLRDIIEDARAAVRAYNTDDKELYRRKDAVVKLDNSSNRLSLSVVTKEEMYSLIARAADWYSIDLQGNTNPVRPDKKVAVDLITCPDEELSELNSVLFTPVIGENGDLIVEPGYNEKHKVFLDVESGLKIPPLPEVIGFADVEAAKKLLLDDLLCDFPFVNKSDLAHAMAALIQPFLRLYFDGCTPLYLIMAPSPGSGKTYLANVISIIATGCPLAAQTLPQTEDEVRKRLTAILAAGSSVILLDNADTNIKVDSSSLSSILTTEDHTDRLLGYSRVITSPNKSLWLMTANNPQLSNELARRTLRVKLDSKCERPYERVGFKHLDLTKWALDNRAELVYSILVIIKNWLDQGAKPFAGQSLASFVDYSLKIGGILQSAGIGGFLEDHRELYDAADIETKEWEYLAVAWSEQFKDSQVRVSQILDLCHQCEVLADIIGFGNLRSQQTRLGNALMKMKDRVIGSWLIKLSQGGRTHGKYYALVSKSGADAGKQLNLAMNTDINKRSDDNLEMQLDGFDGFKDNFDNHDNLLATPIASRGSEPLN